MSFMSSSWRIRSSKFLKYPSDSCCCTQRKYINQKCWLLTREPHLAFAPHTSDLHVTFSAAHAVIWPGWEINTSHWPNVDKPQAYAFNFVLTLWHSARVHTCLKGSALKLSVFFFSGAAAQCCSLRVETGSFLTQIGLWAEEKRGLGS